MEKQVKTRVPHTIRNRVLLVLASLLLAVAVVGSAVLSVLADSVDAFAATPVVQISDEQKEINLQEASTLASQVEAESTVLLQNKDNTLPLSADVKKVNVFGWASTAWLAGGSGSGQVTSVDVDFLSALTNYGIEYNTELTDMYKNFQDGREYTGTLSSWPEQSCRLYEPSIDDTNYYSQTLLDNAKAFSNTAIVVFGRLSGESNDCTQVQYKRTTKGGDIVEDDSRTYLDLSTEEVSLLQYVAANYENVVVVLNTGNVMAVGEVETIPGVDACLAVGLTGSDGASVLPAVLWGETEPAGRTADTWAYDFSTAASYANAGANGVGAYSNAEGVYPADGTTTGNVGNPAFAYDQVSYVDYAEGIYIGYKWYETADAENFWADVNNEHGAGYEGVVQYPFGYGLSYTSFDWKVSGPANGTALNKDGTVDVTVTVTNTGSVAGKDVVELYYTAPYTPGGIEKSAVELGAFAKTDLLQPGESQDVTLSLAVEDMASYDYNDANKNGFTGYELDAGDYVITLRHDAHTVDDDAAATITLNLDANAQYPTDSKTGLEVNNKFTGSDAIDGISLDGTDSDQNIVYLTRADFAGTFPTQNVDSRPMADNLKATNLYTSDMADAWIDDSDEAVTTGANNGLKIEDDNGQTTDLGYQLGANYDDPQWDALLDQLTVDEMENMYINAYGNTVAMDSINKMQGIDTDGPAQVGSWGRPSGKTIGFPSASTVSQSWNTSLALEMGHAHGKMALQNGYSGLYAPAANMHRSPFDGRNYEYYSEDSYLSGEMSGNAVKGIQDMGVYCYVKHLVCNDGESGIYRDSVYTWMTEQALREIYLEPFRIMIEDYDAQGMMSSYNRIGGVWSGGSEALLTGVLRDEWNFHGAVITDYADHHQYMSGDAALRAGGDLWMAGFGGGELACEIQSNSYMQALRRAAKDTLYMYLHVRVMNRDYSQQIGDESVLRPLFKASMANWRMLVVAIDVVAVVLFALALRAVILDNKLRKAAKNAENNKKD